MKIPIIKNIFNTTIVPEWSRAYKKEIKNDFSKRDKIKREILMWSPTAILTIFTIVTFIRGS